MSSRLRQSTYQFSSGRTNRNQYRRPRDCAAATAPRLKTVPSRPLPRCVSKLAHEIEIADRHTAEVMESSQAVIGDLRKTNRHFGDGFNRIRTTSEAVITTVTKVSSHVTKLPPRKKQPLWLFPVKKQWAG